MSQTATATKSYTVADIEKVATRVRADLMMIGDSTGCWTPQAALDRAHDIEVLAKAGYLKRADVMLFSGEQEVQAVRFDVNAEAGSLTSSRPGGVRWPRVANARLRIVLSYTSAYSDTVAAAIAPKLKLSWSSTNLDTSHATLRIAGGRDYVSNSYGMQRQDWAA
jgi:hypothetical protein